MGWLNKHKRLVVATVVPVLLLSVALGLLLQGLGRGPQEESFSAAPPPVALEEILAEEVSVLTGLPIKDGGPRGQRICAVTVNNIAHGRPSRGLSSAQMLVETEVEGGLTRMMALYEDYRSIPEVGPLRSFRRQFFELVLPFQPILVNYGSNVFLNEQLDEYRYHPWNISMADERVFYYDTQRRQAGYPMENTRYTNGELITKEIIETDMDDARVYNSGYFQFVPFNQAPRQLQGGPAEALYISFSVNQLEEEASISPYATGFLYDNGKGQYKMFQHNSSLGEVEPTVDENNGQQLIFDNVVVLFATMAPRNEEDGSSGKVVDFGGGAGYYFNGGRYEKIRWQKGGPQEALHLLSGDGTERPVAVNPGTTYMALVDVEMASRFIMGEAVPW